MTKPNRYDELNRDERELADKLREIVYVEMVRPCSDRVSQDATAIAAGLATSTPCIVDRKPRDDLRYRVGVTAFDAYGSTLKDAMVKYAEKRIENTERKLEEERVFRDEVIRE